MEYVRDAMGMIQYSFWKTGSHTTVYNKDGMAVGYLKDGKTYDKDWRLISNGENMSMLPVGR